MVAIALPEPFAVSFRIRGVKYLRSRSPFLVPFVSPCREHPNIYARLVGALDDIIHVAEIVFIRLKRIILLKRKVSVRIGNRESFPLRENDGLNHIEFF